MTYIISSITPSTQDDVWILPAPVAKPSAGLFYVRWWARDSSHPAETKFESRAAAIAKITELYRDAPYVRIEMLEATEWGTRSRSKRA